ncbi:MAG: isopentenyl-diphosphate Delta-isomerase [Gammaproteobacteria bacterium]|nr:isopentenyl-diphosphate Delta-isomerase [Gammaproteobacteria bacterium]
MHDVANRVVSNDSEELILVDEDDRDIGSLNKAHCHDGDGVLHRAFSLFLFNDKGELLLQQRSADKRLWPLYWSNTCCSHPRLGEDMTTATRRRLEEELGIDAETEFVYKFTYQARFGAAGSENELCWVFLGRCNDKPVVNRTEIAAIRLISVADLNDDLESRPEIYTPWFKMEWQRLLDQHAETLRNYSNV